MNKKTLDDLEGRALEGMRALVRVDFNVPLDGVEVTDDTRIRAALPTIRALRSRGARVILLSHLGRPKGKRDPALTLRPVAGVLETQLGVPVTFIDDPTTEHAVKTTRRLKRGEVAMVENTRFWAGEEANDDEFATSLAALGDFYVNDAFGSAHRAHASTDGVARRLQPAVAGLLMAEELRYLGNALADPARPFIAVIGGAKISGKIDVVESLLPRVDAVLIGGAMACTFFLAMGLEVGASLVEPERVDLARDLLTRGGEKLVLPDGATVAQKLERDVATRDVPRDAIPADSAMYDIDAGARETFAGRIRAAKTVVWNGPMGVFEVPPFDRGTISVAHAMAEATDSGAVTIVGGGDSAAAIAVAGLSERVSHVSTGGGASLEFLEGKVLPGVTVLDDA